MPYPPFLYRYRAINDYSLDEIRQNHVYFTPLSELNDLIEGRYSLQVGDLEKVRSLLVKRAIADSNPEFETILQEMPAEDLEELVHPMLLQADSAQLEARRRFGVVCFSERYDNEMMWGHYAKYGSGIVIEYDLRPVPIPDGALQRVTYCDDPATVFLSSVLSAQNEGQFVEVLSIKRKCWEHEQEWRLLLTEPNRVMPLPFRISRVITGPKCPDADKQRVVAAVLQHGSARFVQAYLDGGYRITLHDILGGI